MGNARQKVSSMLTNKEILPSYTYNGVIFPTMATSPWPDILGLLVCLPFVLFGAQWHKPKICDRQPAEPERRERCVRLPKDVCRKQEYWTRFIL